MRVESFMEDGDDQQTGWPMSDPVDGLKARDSKIWNQMYEAYATRLYGFILHLVRRDQRLAEDLHQETWMAAINGIAGFDLTRGEFSAWLFSIARNAVATHWRRAANSRVTGHWMKWRVTQPVTNGASSRRKSCNKSSGPMSCGPHCWSWTTMNEVP